MWHGCVRVNEHLDTQYAIMQITIMVTSFLALGFVFQAFL